MTYYLGSKDYTHSIRPKKVTMTYKIIREKSICAECVSSKSRFLKQKTNKKVVKITLILN